MRSQPPRRGIGCTVARQPGQAGRRDTQRARRRSARDRVSGDRDRPLREQIGAYRQLETEYGANVAVAVRSSATAEDLPSASFAGQHESFLNVSGADELFEACRRCFASIFTDRAISYRIDNGFDHFKVALSVGVMKMVRSDRAASGVIFTLDTESGFRDVVFVTGVYGLGENIVQGTVDPDEFYVHKPTFRAGRRAVLSRSLGRKQLRMIYADGGGTKNVPCPRSGARALLPHGCRGARSSPAMRSRSKTTIRRTPVIQCPWISNGPKMAMTGSSTSSRRGPRPWCRNGRRQAFETYALGCVRSRAGDGPRGRREDRRRSGAGHCRRASTCATSSPATCSSQNRRRPIGSR